ncbi:MAG TPA: hypothetical protein PKJ95_00095 [Atribacterota bacterium]|jgi:hypothetical protein|nr:hypothetical protein [Atribacterota bacterium]
MEFRPFCLDTVTDSQDLRIKEKKREESGMYIEDNGKMHPVFKKNSGFICPEISNGDYYDDIPSLIAFCKGPVNLTLHFKDNKEKLIDRLKNEIDVYQWMIDEAKFFLKEAEQEGVIGISIKGDITGKVEYSINPEIDPHALMALKYIAKHTKDEERKTKLKAWIKEIEYIFYSGK